MRVTLKDALKHLSRMVEVHDEECYFDHHGDCQAHFVERPCRVEVAREFLKNAKSQQRKKGKR
jgi:hypothetical protein